MPAAEPDVEAVASEIGRIAVEQAIPVSQGAVQNPAHMRPPFPVARGMWIARLVRELVMESMHGNQ